MLKLFYKLLCWLRNEHNLSGWENQYAFGYTCKCGLHFTVHKKQVEWIKNGKNNFTITFKSKSVNFLEGKIKC